LGILINNMTHNYKLAQDCFKKFFICLAQYRKQFTENPEDPSLVTQKGVVIRSLFTVGLLCQHFEFDQGKFTVVSHDASCGFFVIADTSNYC
jgi:cohesin loading factor subunit SCC2